MIKIKIIEKKLKVNFALQKMIKASATTITVTVHGFFFLSNTWTLSNCVKQRRMPVYFVVGRSSVAL